jgi:hypothetical protein
MSTAQNRLKLRPQPQDQRRRTDEHQAAGAEDAGAQRPEQPAHVGVLARADEEGADDGADGADAHDAQRQHERVES